VPPAFHPDIEVFGGETVGRLRLNRPDRLNALTSPVMSAVIEAAEWFDTQTRIRAVVISGAGDSFCAGFDAAEFASLRGFEDAVPVFRLGARLVDTVEVMRPVTVAALHGNVVGGGVALAAACDLRIAADDTVFSIPEVDLGIPLLWDAIPRLVREIGPTRTKELVMTCRPFRAVEAERMGFLNHIVPATEVMTAADKLAGEIAARPPMPVEMTKRQVAATLNGEVSPVDEEAFRKVLTDPDCLEQRAGYLRRFAT
jgi:enoyl-CoA hydratase/carnithine racemase